LTRATEAEGQVCIGQALGTADYACRRMALELGATGFHRLSLREASTRIAAAATATGAAGA